MRILVVDDIVAQVESLKLLLDAMGHETMTALTAESASVLADTHPPDALVLDWVLPGGGASFVRHLRAKPGVAARGPLPVVVVTGAHAGDVDTEGLAGVTVLQKPYSVDMLAEALGPPAARTP